MRLFPGFAIFALSSLLALIRSEDVSASPGPIFECQLTKQLDLMEGEGNESKIGEMWRKASPAIMPAFTFDTVSGLFRWKFHGAHMSPEKFEIIQRGGEWNDWVASPRVTEFLTDYFPQRILTIRNRSGLPVRFMFAEYDTVSLGTCK